MVQVNIQAQVSSLRTYPPKPSDSQSAAVFRVERNGDFFYCGGRIIIEAVIVAITLGNEVKRGGNPPRVQPLPDELFGCGQVRKSFLVAKRNSQPIDGERRVSKARVQVAVFRHNVVLVFTCRATRVQAGYRAGVVGVVVDTAKPLQEVVAAPSVVNVLNHRGFDFSKAIERRTSFNRLVEGRFAR